MQFSALIISTILVAVPAPDAGESAKVAGQAIPVVQDVAAAARKHAPFSDFEFGALNFADDEFVPAIREIEQLEKIRSIKIPAKAAAVVSQIAPAPALPQSFASKDVAATVIESVKSVAADTVDVKKIVPTNIVETAKQKVVEAAIPDAVKSIIPKPAAVPGNLGGVVNEIKAGVEKTVASQVEVAKTAVAEKVTSVTDSIVEKKTEIVEETTTAITNKIAATESSTEPIEPELAKTEVELKNSQKQKSRNRSRKNRSRKNRSR